MVMVAGALHPTSAPSPPALSADGEDESPSGIQNGSLWQQVKNVQQKGISALCWYQTDILISPSMTQRWTGRGRNSVLVFSSNTHSTKQLKQGAQILIIRPHFSSFLLSQLRPICPMSLKDYPEPLSRFVRSVRSIFFLSSWGHHTP